MNVGILLTSNDSSQFARRFPNDGEKFADLLRPIRPQWDYHVYHAIDGILPASPQAHDGYIITGSPASIHDGHSWIAQLFEFVGKVIRLRIPLIGACFGHQAVAHVLGATVGKNPQGWIVGTAQTQFEPQGWMQPRCSVLTLFAAHKEQVLTLPDEAVCIGKSSGVPYAAFLIGDHIMTTQYHPEMPHKFMVELIDEMGDELTNEQANLARQQISGGAQGPLFGQWMVQFLEMKRV